ncbi:MAG TPA: CPBP family intramembrane glutamic endopeptidase [Rhodanobacteraceae bacterium]|nr:CPBP family intramembrane glutamic endopeptidase [Rhodanobacteraceae bacterium]
MAIADLAFLAFIAAALLVDHFVLWPRFVRLSVAEPARARVGLWSSWIAMLWILTAITVGLWIVDARDWAALRVKVPHGASLYVSIGLGLLLAAAYARAAVRIIRARGTERIRKVGDPGLEKLLPHTPAELCLWVALSLSAGIGEEVIFRGYLITAFEPLLGVWGAALCSLVVFTLAHAYQGARWMWIPGVYGFALTLVVLLSGSLFPAIVLHALVDIGQGLVGWLALDDPESPDGSATAGTLSTP